MCCYYVHWQRRNWRQHVLKSVASSNRCNPTHGVCQDCVAMPKGLPCGACSAALPYCSVCSVGMQSCCNGGGAIAPMKKFLKNSRSAPAGISFSWPAPFPFSIRCLPKNSLNPDFARLQDGQHFQTAMRKAIAVPRETSTERHDMGMHGTASVIGNGPPQHTKPTNENGDAD